jgi:hypothetical protein
MSTALNNHSTRSTVLGTVAISEMKCAVLLRVFSLPNQSKAFRKGTVSFLLPPFSTGCAKMVGFPHAHKSRAFELNPGDPVTNHWAAEMIGKTRQVLINYGIGSRFSRRSNANGKQRQQSFGKSCSRPLGKPTTKPFGMKAARPLRKPKAEKDAWMKAHPQPAPIE